MGPLLSDTFASNAADAAGIFYSDARPVTNAHASTAGSFSVSYNATTQSYTVSTGSRTQTFAPADQVSSGSTDFKAFVKSAGTLGESLSLTVPGSSGALKYQYVGGGAWERVVNGGSTLDFTYNPFTYGIATPDANLARTGTGTYSVSLVGARETTLPYAMAGSGTMQVDFAGSKLESAGVLTTINVSTGQITSLGIFYGAAQLSSTTNNFAGTFSMDDGSRFTGGWEGRFYGPANQEVGATWYMSNTSGQYAAGWLIGRSDNSVAPYNTSLDTLRYTEAFDTRFAELDFHDNGNGTVGAGSIILRSDGSLKFDASTPGFVFKDALNKNAGTSTAFPASTLNAGASTNSVAVYDMVGGGTPYRLSLLKPGSGNPTIALSYASFGHWQQMQNGGVDAQDRWFAWGTRTNAFQIPTGTGHFDGIIAGTGAVDGGGAAYTLTGTSSFDVNFGAATFSGTLHPIGTDRSTLATRDFGTFSVNAGIMDRDGGLSGNVATGSTYLGWFEGALYGPQATEIGGTFGFVSTQLNSWDPGYQTKTNLTGVIVGKR